MTFPCVNCTCTNPHQNGMLASVIFNPRRTLCKKVAQIKLQKAYLHAFIFLQKKIEFVPLAFHSHLP